MTGFAVIDVETTGVYYRRDQILEVGVIQLDDQLGETFRWSSLINPQRAVTGQHVHGICDTDVAGAPTLADVAAEVMSLLAGRVLVAHNAVFDVNHLMLGLQRAGVPLPDRLPAVIDTMRLSGRVVGARSLAQACEVLSIDLVGAHEAVCDAAATSEMLRRLVDLDPDALPGATYSYVPAADSGTWRGGPGVVLSDAVDPVSAVLHTGTGTSWPGLPDPAPIPGPGYCRQSAVEHHRHSTGYLARLVGQLPVIDDDPDSDALPYLALLDEAVEDRLVTPAEAETLVAAAGELGLSQFEVSCAHTTYMSALATAAWTDGIVTDQERDDLLAVAGLLSLPPAAVGSALDAAQHQVSAHRLPTASRIATSPGDRVVFTGEMSRSRAELESHAVQVGLVPTSSISGRTALLIIADPHSQSRKASRARELGVRLISETVFLEVCTELSR